jgi:hypothetical protein
MRARERCLIRPIGTCPLRLLPLDFYRDALRMMVLTIFTSCSDSSITSSSSSVKYPAVCRTRNRARDSFSSLRQIRSLARKSFRLDASSASSPFATAEFAAFTSCGINSRATGLRSCSFHPDGSRPKQVGANAPGLHRASAICGRWLATYTSTPHTTHLCDWIWDLIWPLALWISLAFGFWDLGFKACPSGPR